LLFSWSPGKQEDHMSITVNFPQRAQPVARSPREQASGWTVGLLLLALGLCMVAVSLYVGAPIIDPTFVGP
jgi:hypothetical protein